MQFKIVNKKNILPLSLILLLLTSCSTFRNGHIWGEDVNFLPGWEKIQNAAYNAATAPETWVPLSGALLVRITGTDHDISQWAIKRTPVFGSQNNATSISDHLLNFSLYTYISSALFAPGGEKFGNWIYAKTKGYSVGVISYFTTRGITDYLKTETDRLRPDKTNNKSFPSGHTSKTSTYLTLAVRNLESYPYFSKYPLTLHAGHAILTAAAGWSRIEAGRHYPTDVLVGAALGNFVGIFLNDAFIGIEHTHDIDLNMSLDQNSYILNLQVKF